MVVLGIDEVGRGCWAGPLVAGAVILKRAIPGVRDSKQLTRKTREALDAVIRRRAVVYGLGWVAPDELDEVGLTAAVRLAYRRALAEITTAYDQIIIDGNYNFLADLPNARAIVKADAMVPAVSAASIIAKVARDAYMREQAAQFPAYGFESHVGYGTLAHRLALSEHGPCLLHRRSFQPLRLLTDTASVGD
ncbi:MAG TPA: ribonuclease HII [Candidatus Saccharimonadales bacterium]|nr:ribonuclease HII [Candidatus Saccharimonadales bacterium]